MGALSRVGALLRDYGTVIEILEVALCILARNLSFSHFVLQIGDRLFVPLLDESRVDINVTLLRNSADIGNTLVSMCMH